MTSVQFNFSWTTFRLLFSSEFASGGLREKLKISVVLSSIGEGGTLIKGLVITIIDDDDGPRGEMLHRAAGDVVDVVKLVLRLVVTTMRISMTPPTRSPRYACVMRNKTPAAARLETTSTSRVLQTAYQPVSFPRHPTSSRDDSLPCWRASLSGSIILRPSASTRHLICLSNESDQVTIQPRPSAIGPITNQLTTFRENDESPIFKFAGNTKWITHSIITRTKLPIQLNLYITYLHTTLSS
jgi:hypothetical protein